MSRGIEVTEHLMPGEADDIPPAPMAFRSWVEKAVREREQRAYGAGYEAAREEQGVLGVALVSASIGFVLGAGVALAALV